MLGETGREPIVTPRRPLATDTSLAAEQAQLRLLRSATPSRRAHLADLLQRALTEAGFPA